MPQPRRPDRRLLAGAAPRQEELRGRRGRLTWSRVDPCRRAGSTGSRSRPRRDAAAGVGLRPRAARTARRRSRPRPSGAWRAGPVPSPGAARRGRGRPAHVAAGHRVVRRRSAWRPPRCSAPCTRDGRARRWRPASRPRPARSTVVSSNAGTPFAEIGARVRGGCRPTCPTDREAMRAGARGRGGRAAAAAVVLTVGHARSPAPKYAADAADWTGVDLELVAGELRRSPTTPGRVKARDLDPGRRDLAARASRACRSWSRACCAATTPVRCLRRRRRGRLGVQPRRSPARPGGRAPRTALPRGRGCGRGRGPRCTSTGASGRGLDALAALALGARGGLRRPPAALRTRRGRRPAASAGCSRDLRDRAPRGPRAGRLRDPRRGPRPARRLSPRTGL